MLKTWVFHQHICEPCTIMTTSTANPDITHICLCVHTCLHAHQCTHPSIQTHTHTNTNTVCDWWLFHASRVAVAKFCLCKVYLLLQLQAHAWSVCNRAIAATTSLLKLQKRAAVFLATKSTYSSQKLPRVSAATTLCSRKRAQLKL